MRLVFIKRKLNDWARYLHKSETPRGVTMTENKPSAYTCEHCNCTYRMGDETTIFIYLRQPWFNHVETTCPQCGDFWAVWELSADTLDYIIENNMEEGDVVHRSIVDFGDDAVERAFCLGTHRPVPKTRFIAPREQAHIDAECAYFAYLLEKGESLT